MLKYEDIVDAPVDKLKAAADDWSEMVTKLDRLAEDATNGMKAKADKAEWEGENAGITKAFIGKTAKEFKDAAAEAKGVKLILEDAHTAIKKAKDDLVVVRDVDGPAAGIHVDAKGKVTARHPLENDNTARHDPDYSELLRKQRDSLEAWQKKIDLIVDNCNETDVSLKRALEANVNEGKDFDAPAYDSLGEERAATKAAEDMALLAKTKGDDMSPEEFNRFSQQLAKYKDDPLFQETFATTLGPRGTLDFWADLADPNDGGDLVRNHRGDMAELQKNFSLVLAGATQSDSPAMQSWERDMVKLGDERIQTKGSQAYGFQIMSNFMRVGDYDDKFLKEYGNALVSTEQKMKLPSHYWENSLGGPAVPKLNFMGEEFGRDPMTGFMTALSNSPDAATDFFNAKEPNDNAQYLLSGKRDTFDDTPLNSGDSNHANAATGKALLAAATGMNPHDPGSEVVPHTPEHREVLERSMKYIAEAGDDFPSEMRQDMATVLGNHSDEVHYSASAQADDPNDPKLLDRNDLIEVTKQVSRDQQAYGVLNEALNQEMVRDIHQDRPTDPKETLVRAGQTTGFLEEARYQALETDKRDPSWDAKWLYHGFGGAANFIPVVGDATQRGVDALAYRWQLEEQGRIDDENQQQNGKVFTQREQQLSELARQWSAVNPAHGQNAYTLTTDINAAAFDGNARARGLSGDQ
ncbi:MULTISPECIES: hypothetical protein [unclassified Streptomyces]|uniref:hypothetical protein n=1 Tax=unclassified Streptomyces TaxID=2593676 RepID=UPI00093BEA81|nr:hypothetical protein [Streptomyces sp. TSRI0281]OKI38540.1 hypothetical protein A6A29_11425 [Streptomyces sp. TSRI0281]